MYARRGLTLFMSSDHENVVGIAVYPPTTAERYQRELHVEEPPEER